MKLLGIIFIVFGLNSSWAKMDSSCQEQFWSDGFYLETFSGDVLYFLDKANCEYAENKITNKLKSQTKVTVWGCQVHYFPAYTGRDPWVDYSTGVLLQGYHLTKDNKYSRSVTQVERESWEQAAKDCVKIVQDKNELYP
ncbi:MAG: hypothetical protein KDD58_08335 [Bdellovibrionales bacterium]|nr:hypothetical protein [Bdellovibrionales bacterium]